MRPLSKVVRALADDVGEARRQLHDGDHETALGLMALVELSLRNLADRLERGV